jgi:hypothetical protein
MRALPAQAYEGGGSGNAGNAGNLRDSANGLATVGFVESAGSPEKSRESQGRWDRLATDGIGIAGLRVPESQNHTYPFSRITQPRTCWLLGQGVAG